MLPSRRANPYIGPRSFEERETLYGRDRELRILTDRLIAERIVLLHSPSGAGKTSLVKAGLIPVMRAEGFHVHPVIRVNRQLEQTSGAGQPETLNRYTYSALLSLEEAYPIGERFSTAQLKAMSLDEYLQCRKEQSQQTLPELLVFDQFEEILTIAPADRAIKIDFFTQLGEALHDRNRWALFVMREDFVGALEPYVRLVPTFFTNTFYLELLGEAAAREAVQQPPKEVGITFTDEAAHKLVDDLRRIQVMQPDGTLADALGLYVEPVQLQVVCFRLWDTHQARRPDDPDIDVEDIAQVGDVDQSLGDYYAASVSRAAQTSGVAERAIREWFDNQLITPEGIRGQVLRRAENSGGLPNPAVQVLVDMHVIRGEERAAKTWYELAHDRLIAPVRANNAAWFQQHLKLFQRQAEVWAQKGHPESLLLRGKELKEARQDVASLVLTSTEQEFIKASGDAQQQAEREKRRNRAVAILAVVATITLGVAIIFGYLAQKNAAQAVASQATAETDRGQAVSSKATADAEKGQAIASASTAEAESRRADRQAQIALWRQVAAQGAALAPTDPDLGMLLAVQASRLQSQGGQGYAPEIRSSLLASMAAVPHPVKYLRGHTGPVRQVAVSPDSRWIASASDDATIRIWEIPSGKALFILTGHRGAVNAAAFVPGRTPPLLASASSDGTVRLWQWTDETTLPQGQILVKGQGNIIALAVSPDGALLAFGGAGKTVHVYDLQSNTERYALTGHTGAVVALAFNAQGSELVSTDDQNDLRLWDMGSGQALNPSSPLSGEAYMRGVAFDPIGNTVYTGIGYNVVEFSSRSTLIQHTSLIRGIAFSHDGQRIASASEDWRIGYYYRCDYCSGKGSIYLKGHDGPVNSVVFSPDDRWLVSGGGDNNVLLWNGYYPLALRTLPGPLLQGRRWNVEGLAFQPDGKTLVSSNWDGSIRFWNVDTGTIDHEFYPGQGTQGVLHLSPDGTKLGFGAEGSLHYIWSQDGKSLGQLQFNPGSNDPGQNVQGLSVVAFSPDGRTVATENPFADGICLYDIRDLSPTCVSAPGPKLTTRIEFSPDGKWLASNGGTADGEVRLWDLSVRPPTFQVMGGDQYHSDYIFGLAFSPDSRWLASGNADYTIRLFDVENPRAAPLVLNSSGRFARSVAFSPDGQMLVSANEDWSVRFWDMETHQMIIPPVRVRFDRLDSLAFSPDGKWMAIGNFDGLIDLWPGNISQWIATACDIANRNLSRAEYAKYVNPNPAAYDQTYAKNPTCPGLPVEARP